MSGTALIPAGAADYAGLAQGRAPVGLALPPGGVEPADVLAMLVDHARRLEAAQGWGCWLMVEAGEVVGSCAVKGVADAAGAVEIGYAVAPERRGRGIAGRAVALVLAELTLRGLAQVRAETAAGNPASAAVLRRCGFVQDGQRHDPEDGPLILWSRELPRAEEAGRPE